MLIKWLEKFTDWLCGRRFSRSMLRALDGELDAKAQSTLAAHLKTCARCRAVYDRQAFAAQLVSRIALPFEPPAGKPEWTQALVLERSDARPRRRLPALPARSW